VEFRAPIARLQSGGSGGNGWGGETLLLRDQLGLKA
jgi:hypothetical protein